MPLCACHLSDGAMQRLMEANLREIICTNTQPMPPSKLLPNISVISVAPLLAQVIQAVHSAFGRRNAGELHATLLAIYQNRCAQPEHQNRARYVGYGNDAISYLNITIPSNLCERILWSM